MALCVSASAAGDLVEGVGGCPQSDRYSADDRKDVGVSLVGGLVAGFGVFGDVVVDGADELACVAFVEPVEGAHGQSVAADSFTPLGLLRDVWLGLTPGHRLLFQAASPVGALLFMVLGACLR